MAVIIFILIMQDKRSISFESLARLCAEVMGKSSNAVNIRYYDKKHFDFGDKKAFPMREQHFFCSGIESKCILLRYIIDCFI
jgi:hypothetical protein